MRSCWWPRVVVEICPSVSPRRMNSDSQAGHKGTTASRSSKRSKAKCRDRVRTVGASLHPWVVTGCRYASERGEPTGRSATPSHRTHRPAHHPINDTREASQLSDLPPLCGALQRCGSAEMRFLPVRMECKPSGQSNTLDQNHEQRRLCRLRCIDLRIGLLACGKG